MDFVDGIRALLRWWFVVVAGLLMTGAGCAAALTLVSTGYQASGQYVLLLPADATGKTTPTNPLLNLPEGLTITGSLLASEVTTKDTVRSLAKQGYTSDYAVALVPGAGPMLNLTVDDTNPQAAVATRDAVIRELDASLARIQKKVGVPPRQVITAQTSAVSSHAEVVPGRRIKAMALIAGLGVVLTLFAALTLDRFRPGRRMAEEASRRIRNAAPGGSAGSRRPQTGPQVREITDDLLAEISRSRSGVR